jgi:AraC family transcriptional regulator
MPELATHLHRQTPGITAQAIDRLWGGSKATGGGLLGLTARLSEPNAKAHPERSRPACDKTHAVSVWVTGCTHSELRLNGKVRFSQRRGPGTFQIARAGESVRTVLSECTGKCLDLYLPDRVLRGCLERDLEKESSGLELMEVGVEHDIEISRIARTVLIELETPADATQVAIDAATLSLCVALIRRWSNRAHFPPPPKPGLAPWRVRRAADILRTSLTDSPTLTELAGEVGMSPYHFLRAFKASVGVPPHRYQMNLRLQRARELLEITDLPMSEIAAHVGYDDPSYLARLFRRHFGTTPVSYRRERRS